MSFVLFHQAVTVYRCLLMDVTLKHPRTVSLCNFNTTYHFLGSRQTARYVNYWNLQFKSTPLYSYSSQLANHLNSILPLTHIQQLNLNTLTLLAITTYRSLGDVPSILLALTVCPPSIILLLSLSLFLHHSSHDLCSSNCYAKALHSSLH
jgi:hypothetical protein